MIEISCVIPGCGRISVVKRHRLCAAHYRRFLRTGDPGSAEIKGIRSKLPPYVPQTNVSQEVVVSIFNLPDWVPVDSWNKFVEFRQIIKAPLTIYGAELAVKQLEKLKSVGFDPQDVMEQSIMNGWRGLFPIKNYSGGNNEKDKRVGFDKFWDDYAAKYGLTPENTSFE